MKYTVLISVVLLCLSATARSQARPDIMDTSRVLRTVDVMPEFSGGTQAWGDFLRGNLNANVINDVLDADTSLPRGGYRERVVLRFIVCEDGGVCNVEVVNKNAVHPVVADEALRVMRLSPPWKPGKVDGQKVKVFFMQPITFASE